MQAVKIIFGVLCFGLSVACVIYAVNALVHHPSWDGGYDGTDAWVPTMFGAMLLLGSFLLLRRSPSPTQQLDAPGGDPCRQR
jgi:hypothetical protein